MNRRFHTRQTTFRQLEIFTQVAQFNSVTLAAKHLHLAQPTVSTQIAKLAEALDVKLFEQIGKQLHITEVGKEVLSSARDLFAVMDNLEMRLALREGLSVGQLKISVVTTAKYLIPNYLGEFCQQFPNIEPEFQVGNRSEIINRLKQNMDDIYVFSNPPDQLDIEAEVLTNNPLVVIAQKDHALALEKNIEWQALAAERLLIRENGSGTRYAIEKHFAKHSMQLHRSVTIASNEAIKESVMAGLGVAILSRHALNHMAPGNLVELSVKGFPIENTWYWVRPKGKAISPAARAFKEHVAQSLAEQR